MRYEGREMYIYVCTAKMYLYVCGVTGRGLGELDSSNDSSQVSPQSYHYIIL